MEVKLQETHEFTLLNRCFYNQDELLTKLGGKNPARKKTHDVPEFESGGGSADEAIVNL